MIGGIDADKSPGPRHAASTLGATLAVVVAWLVLGPPVAGLQWALLLLGALLAGVALTLLAALLLRLAGGSHRHRWRATATPVAATAAALLSTSAVAVVALAPAGSAGDECPQPTELRLIASPQHLTLARDLTAAYVQWTADTADGCPQVNIYSYGLATEQAIEHLGSGWSGEALPEIGPRPDLWLPGAGEEIEALRRAAEGTGGDLIGTDVETFAASPLVLAVAEPAAVDALREDHTWVELLRRAEAQEWAPLRLQPDVSRADELATTALYGGFSSDSMATAFALLVEHRIEDALDAGDYPVSDSDAFLCHYREHAGAAAALLITEYAMVRLNRGDAFGDHCAERDSAGGERLLAHYPTDTLTVDYSLAALRWQGAAGTPQARAAAALQQWLKSPDGRVALVGLGLRPPGQPLDDDSALFQEQDGVLAAAHPYDPVSRPPSDTAIARARAAYQAARRPGRVLLALDVSGSMSGPVDDVSTRFDMARQGVEAALSLLGSRDEFGLWRFPDQGGERELVPIGPAREPHDNRPRAEAATAAMARLSPRGPTPLYRTIVDGVQAVGQAEDFATALVVLTDGEDLPAGGERDPADAEQLAAIDGGAGVRVFVVAIGEASCLVDALARVTSDTGGACVQADFGTLTDQLVELFGVLWSGVTDGS